MVFVGAGDIDKTGLRGVDRRASPGDPRGPGPGTFSRTASARSSSRAARDSPRGAAGAERRRSGWAGQPGCSPSRLGRTTSGCCWPGRPRTGSRCSYSDGGRTWSCPTREWTAWSSLLRTVSWSAFETLPDGRIRAGAGLRLKQLCGLAAKAGLSGFEFLEGIPGNVGGALRMNAGAMGGWIFDVVDEVRLDGHGRLR